MNARVSIKFEKLQTESSDFCMYLQSWYLCMHVNTCAGMWVGGTLYSRGQRLMIHLPQLLSTLYTEQGFSHEPEPTDWV